LKPDLNITGPLEYKYHYWWAKNVLVITFIMMFLFNILASPIFFYVGFFRPSYLLVFSGIIIIIFTIYVFWISIRGYNELYFGIYRNGVYIRDPDIIKAGKYPFIPYSDIRKIEYRRSSVRHYLTEIILFLDDRDEIAFVHNREKEIIIALLDNAWKNWCNHHH